MNNQMQQQFMQRMRGFNPSSVLYKIASNEQMMENPMIRNVIEMRNNNDTNGLNNMAENMFKENGMDFSDFQQKMKQQLNFK